MKLNKFYVDYPEGITKTIEQKKNVLYQNILIIDLFKNL